eukprot:SAG31_NODE_950_length_10811_cov_4.497760_1_plen_179_part_10
MRVVTLPSRRNVQLATSSVFFLLAGCALPALADPVNDANVDSDDYYKVLGLAKDCDEKAIKKHYRKLAMHWHPDKNKAPEAETNFKRIAEAYEVLSDPKARKAYDQGGKDFLKSGGGGQSGGRGFDFGFGAGGGFKSRFSDARDIFKEAFGGKDPFENFEEFFGGDGFVDGVFNADPRV